MKYDFVVSQDGSGDFLTIQEAIDAAGGKPTLTTEYGRHVDEWKADRPVVIGIKPGIYIENCTFSGNTIE